MDDALRTAMSLEVLDKSKENYKKSWRSYDEPFEDEPCRKKEKISRLAENTVEAVEGVVKPESSEVAVTQLQKVLASCMKEMAVMRKAFGTVKGPSAQPNTTVQRGNRPSFNQAAGGPPNNNNSDHVHRRHRQPVAIVEWDLVSRIMHQEGPRSVSDADSGGTLLPIVQTIRLWLQQRR